MKKIIFSFGFLVLISSMQLSAQTIEADNTTLALTKLAQTQKQLLVEVAKAEGNKFSTIEKMFNLGMWDKALLEMKKLKPGSFDYKVLQTDYLILNNDFKAADNMVKELNKLQPKNPKVILFNAYLDMMAWKLPQAANICEQALKINPSSAIKMMLGKIKLLQKDYARALALAKEVQKSDSKNALAYQLEADVYFWDQHPELAEAPLKKSLEIDPFNADARFSYGYAIWRRIDATQLNAMAAQWEIALAVNPLHFQTHWHWGNGHTNLTYADYAQKDDDEVRKELIKADDLFKANKIQEAIDFTRTVEKKYPASVIPKLHRGSLYHAAFDMDRKSRLDSAENIFKQILAVKKHYGPAHNGLSAVIKSKRIPYLSQYDSITNRLLATKITDMENFIRVFPDATYYPGDIAKGMIWNQLNTAVVYFPFLSKGDNVFRVQPLHLDLATVMNSPSFRFNTTFDNRQWMDIRGVGSGAASIEYTERGAYMERNVLLHEYVHLFHGRVLTDDENRQVRKRYYTAMKEGRTLDYYSQNNESEYLAQTYPAYFEPEKVHPLDFKSMNTTADLKTKDPEMYAFLDKLVKKERAYLNGDKSVMASNWANVYLNLSNRVRMNNADLATKYLDTALTYDDKYLPAILAYAKINTGKRDFEAAEKWIKKAENINANYAPVYVAYADLAGAKQINKLLDDETAIKQQAEQLTKSYKLEDDYQELARVNILLREMYKKNALIPEAIAAADDYSKNGATVSTYLRDRIDDAKAFSASLKAANGYVDAIEVLRDLVAQKPQNFEYRNLYADALATHGNYKTAIETIKQAQRILAASGNARSDYNLRLAEFYSAGNQADSVNYYVNLIKSKSAQLKDNDKLRLARLLSSQKNSEEALKLINSVIVNSDPLLQADLDYTKAKVFENDGNQDQALLMYEQVLKSNPYQFSVYKYLINRYQSVNNTDKVTELLNKRAALKIQPGKLFN
ncbi:tetratricopeptide repeat protein [Pedobacter punctiformis]|uniref:Tetratricopeptide repeat protein n=1 Tax=Pedobacter punctiformis TaxID=3004097 RepID=A0ABT4LB52_9SPHI|nr:tetratricopeptide repeat protein [Pedobacter sp. HCMS5-2]MCZ4245096.1 tetratricopeptide repeat protein [Pedobacter sp. HCMS5-2]